MLRRASDWKELTITSTEGQHVGHVRDLYFDDAAWQVRYLVVNVGNWLNRDLVLLSTASVVDVDWEDGLAKVNLTREQIENSPDVSTEQLASQQAEADLHQHYGWAGYWTTMPIVEMPTDAQLEHAKAADARYALRSVDEVIGYNVHPTDGDTSGDIGHIRDFFIAESDWSIGYLLADTGGWLGGKQVLLAQSWLQQVRWSDASVVVNVRREHVESAPKYDPHMQWDTTAEHELNEHYNHPGTDSSSVR